MLWPIQRDHHGISGTRKSTVRVQHTAVCDRRPAREKMSDYAQCAHCYSASVRVWQRGEEYVGGSSLERPAVQPLHSSQEGCAMYRHGSNGNRCGQGCCLNRTHKTLLIARHVDNRCLLRQPRCALRCLELRPPSKTGSQED